MRGKKITAVAAAAAMAASMTAVVPVQTVFAETTTINVGADSDDDFASIRDAVNSITTSPTSESERITINVDPGDYEEQVKIQNLKYITLRQTPGTTGTVNLHWYYCTGYCAGDCGLDGNYDPKINWSDSRTWSGYNEGDTQLTEYELGQSMTKGSTISYYDTDGVLHENVTVQKDHLGDFNDQAALYINSGSSDIIVEDFNIVNSIPVMVTEGEKRVGVAPQEDRNSDNATSYVLPRRDNLTICSEDTEMDGTDRIATAFKISDDASKVKALEALENLTAEESAYLVRSSKYNERGHAVSANGDRITFNGIRLRGNQDSLYISTGRMYFKDCDLIGGTDYIYGDATAVFDNCKLGAEGMSNQTYGATVTAANHDAKNPYGYLFLNCELYNVLDNIGTSQYGRPWRQDAQITFYNTLIDDTKTTGASAAGISDKGWSDMSGNEAAKARFYEYGTTTRSGKTVDTSKRLVNESGFGSVLDDWQILEFNPRNYYNSDFWLTTKGKSEWDPMNFGDVLSKVDAVMAASTINVPEGEDTVVELPQSSDSDVVLNWESASTNAIVSSDKTKLTVVRPAAGEDPITTTVTLYAKDTTTGYGDKKEIPVTIAATTDTENVFDIPVTLNQSVAQENTYTITVSKEGALIKKQEISVSDTTTEAVIEGIPADSDGIEYDIKVVSASDDITVTVPENGEITITGITGQDVPLTITALKQEDKTVDLGIDYSSSDGFASYDLISLAKESGASDEIESSETITVTYTLDVTPSTSGKSYVDVLATEPSTSIKTSGVTSRFLLAKLSHWNQVDIVDSAQAYSGSKNGDDQWLNACGKFTENIPSTVSVIIDYKNKTLSAQGSGSNSLASYTFATFPESYEQGKLYMGIYSGGETFGVSDVSVTYKHIVTGDEPDPTATPEPTPLPAGEGTYKFPGNNSSITNGNQCDNSDTFIFVDGVDSEVKSLLADSDDDTKIDASLMEHYKNYICGTATNGTHPIIAPDAPAGYYRLYLVGYNHGNNVNATTGGKTFTAEAGVNLAYKESNTSYVLKYYAMDIEFPGKGSTITFDSTDKWLPDTYCIVMTGIEAPVTDPTIVSAQSADGKTTVTTANISEGVLIAVTYDDNGVPTAVKLADVSSDTTEIDGIEADKIYAWNSATEMVSLCEPYEIVE